MTSHETVCILNTRDSDVCQHMRLDSRQAENALMSTVAYADNE
jgi:hypothetical protein